MHDRSGPAPEALNDLVNVIAADSLIPESVSYMKAARAALSGKPPDAARSG